ncbi:MAG: hypothetical protein KC478_08505 [Bacteriovoracaceae bacterium]|nr:hypothetical protein [Bacteriovoracaceae bacterium]
MHLLIGEKVLSDCSEGFGKPNFSNAAGALYFGNETPALEVFEGDKRLYLFGDLHYYMSNGSPVRVTSSSFSHILELAGQSIEKLTDSLEGHYHGVYFNGESVSYFADWFGREDIYYIPREGGALASNELRDIVSHRIDFGYDQVGLANFMNIYGFYAPKKHTLYRGVKRVGVGEFLLGSSSGVELKVNPREMKEVQEYNSEDKERYFEIYKSAVELRSTENGTNWVFMSSGWDSSSILAMLVHLHGKEKVKCVINRLQYSSEVGIVNNFEIERAQKITDYFGVELNIVDQNFCVQDYLDHVEEIKDDLRSKSLLTFTSEPFWRSARFIKQNGSEDDVIFSGEISDGAHNFGFAQYATILDHSDLGFREYSDKMASYLYGPSFFKKIDDGSYKDDLIYKILKDYKKIATLAEPSEMETKEWKKQLVASFFISANRFPFAQFVSHGLLTEYGSENYLEEITKDYFSDFINEVKPETLYSWWLHIYNSFHWQGNTVQVILKSPSSQGLGVGIPFWDKRMIDFLSSMPEEWGRGLDIKRTKYPLKWILDNKIDYPGHLQTGPHSYIYDVDPSWSAEADFLYGSIGVKGYKEALATRDYRKYFDRECFDVDKLDKIVDDYLNDLKTTGTDRSILVRLICLASIKLY